MPDTIPLSLYVHIPWCVKKCPYCDFNSHEKSDSFDENLYIEALISDLDDEYERSQHISSGQRSLSSIFFGGGTPSLFSADGIHQIIDHARGLFGFDDIEVTLEANPGTFEQEKFTGFRQAGVNRLSIGIQSFQQEQLQALGRIHDSRQALDAIDTARRADFDNINLDLMFGLPQQTMQQAIDDIKTACAFQPTHISHYQLTIEENTYFHKHTPVLPENEQLWDMQIRCQELLQDNGYQQYEISAYSQPGKRCRHNINYWQFGDYIGIGAGAHGKLTRQDQESGNTIISRRWKHRQPQQYMQQTMQGNALSGQQDLDQKDTVFEFLLNALRLKSGCDLKTFQNNTGLPITTLESAIRDIDSALLFYDNTTIRTTDKGFLFLNEILEGLLDD